MKIQLDKIETVGRISALGLKDHYDRKYCSELYYDTDLAHYIVVRKPDNVGRKFSGRIMVPPSAVSAALVAPESVPTHQPVGTPETHDTPSGRRKQRSVKGGKEEIAKRAAARSAAKKSAD